MPAESRSLKARGPQPLEFQNGTDTFSLLWRRPVRGARAEDIRLTDIVEGADGADNPQRNRPSPEWAGVGWATTPQGLKFPGHCADRLSKAASGNGPQVVGRGDFLRRPNLGMQFHFGKATALFN